MPVLEQGEQILRQIGFSVSLIPLLSFAVAVAAGPDLVEQFDKLIGHDRFEQILHAVKPNRLTGVFKVAVSAENDKIGIRKMIPLNDLQQFQAVHHRHLDIGNDQIHRMLFEKGQRLPSVGDSSFNRKSKCIPVHKHSQALGNKRLIVNQQYFQQCLAFRHPAAPPPGWWLSWFQFLLRSLP